MAYSRAVRKSVLMRVLPPNQENISVVSVEMGIDEQTIKNWLKEEKDININSDSSIKSPRSFSSKEKYLLLMESRGVSDEDFGEFLRTRGIHSEHLTLWEQEIREMVSKKETKEEKKVKELSKKVRRLEKELLRKDKALAEAAALLILKKKLDFLTTEKEDD